MCLYYEISVPVNKFNEIDKDVLSQKEKHRTYHDDAHMHSKVGPELFDLFSAHFHAQIFAGVGAFNPIYFDPAFAEVLPVVFARFAPVNVRADVFVHFAVPAYKK